MKTIPSFTAQATVYYYITFFLATNFVNKYVLSVLKFTYPTIFQGWQVMVGALILWSLAVTGNTNLNMAEYHRTTLVLWSPATVLYTMCIYTGSVSLAKLPIPMFFSARSLITVASFIIDYALHRKAARQLVLLPLLLSFTLAAVYTDPEYNPRGYAWVGANISFVVLYEIYVKTYGTRVNLSSVDRVFCNYVCAVILLAPSSMLLGDVMAAKQYEFFYFYKFYMGCFASGVFGVILVLQGIKLNEAEGEMPNKEFLLSLSKILTSFISLLLFSFTLSVANILCISFTLGTELLMIEQFGRTPHPAGNHGDIANDRLLPSDDAKQKSNGYGLTVRVMGNDNDTVSI